MPTVHQFTPVLEPGAVGSHTLEIRSTLQAAGWESEIFSARATPGFGTYVPFTEYGASVAADPDDVLLYHVAIGSEVGDFVADRRERVAVDHHNITPVEYYERWTPEVGPGIRWGRRQLAALAPRSTFGLADSAFNRSELTAAGCRRSAVVPILVDLDGFDRECDPARLAALERAKDDGGIDLLFVGRIAPNKCQHDLVKMLAIYRRHFDPRARLHLVGGISSPEYVEALRAFADALGISGAVNIPGGVSSAELRAHYRAADVFASASEHEGFCVPLLEAWHHDLPVVARSTTAVPETVRDAGVLLPDRSAELFATAVARVTADSDLREGLVAAGRRRLEDFALPRTRTRLLETLTAFLETDG